MMLRSRGRPEQELALTVTCHASATDRLDLPAMRWFDAVLAVETVAGEDVQLRDVALGELVLISLESGLGEAFVQADAQSTHLSDFVGDLISLQDAGLFGARHSTPPHALVLNRIHVPESEQGRGYGTRLLALLIDHFAFLTGHGIVLANPVPDVVATDPFSVRAADQRLKHLLTTAGFQQPSIGNTWWFEYPSWSGDLGRSQ